MAKSIYQTRPNFLSGHCLQANRFYLFVCLLLSYFAVKRSYEQAFIISVSV